MQAVAHDESRRKAQKTGPNGLFGFDIALKKSPDERQGQKPKEPLVEPRHHGQAPPAATPKTVDHDGREVNKDQRAEAGPNPGSNFAAFGKTYAVADIEFGARGMPP